MMKTLNFLVIITAGLLLLSKVALVFVDQENFLERAISVVEFFVLISTGFYLATMTKEG